MCNNLIMEEKTMKRMILGTMMCVAMTAGVLAQGQDSIRKRDFRHEGPRQHSEMRIEKRDFMRKNDIKKSKCDKITPEQRAELKTKFISEKLSLTPDQNEQLNKVFIKEIETLRKGRAELENQNEVAKKELFKNIKIETNNQVKQILNDEQYALYREMKNQRHRPTGNNHRHHIGHHGKGHPQMKHRGNQENCSVDTIKSVEG